jgi:cobalt-zinc-cadmium efflux system protein
MPRTEPATDPSRASERLLESGAHGAGDSGHGHDHSHAHAAGPSSGAKLGVAVGVVFLFCIVEAICGTVGHSLALLSDSGHNLTDAAALGLSWYAICMAKKPSHGGMTFGYHRVGILAALVNAVSLVVIALGIVWEGIVRLRNPAAVNGAMMMGIATIALVMNAVLGVWLHRGAKRNINIRAAYIHMAGDAVSSLGVIVAGIVVTATGARMADPIVSFVIAGLILQSSWGILTESVNVLLEGTPWGLDTDQVVATIKAVPGVIDCHDLHVWTVGPGAIACSVHILVAEQTIRQGQQILRAVTEKLDHEFHINHATVQVEVEGHSANEMYCCIESGDAGHGGHRH